MQPPSLAPYARLLIELATHLAQGTCCLLVGDKGWTLPLFAGLRSRLRTMDRVCECLDGHPPSEGSPQVWVQGGPARDDVGIMLVTIVQLRRAIQGEVAKRVLVLPHLDLMTARDAGMTNVSREVVPLLYENPHAVFLGFQDPSLPLLPVVEKLFERRYIVREPYRQLEDCPIPEAIPIPEAVPVSGEVVVAEPVRSLPDQHEPPAD
jgi:hypothetical protein